MSMVVKFNSKLNADEVMYNAQLVLVLDFLVMIVNDS